MSNKASEKIDVHVLDSNLLRALWVLDYLATKDKDRFNQSDISDYMVETCGINTTRQAIDFALKGASKKNLINKNNKGFKIMQAGIDFLSESNRRNDVYFFESGTEFETKRITFKSLFVNKSHTVYICDPFVDVNTLDVIHESLPKSSSIKILTQKIISTPKGSFERHIESMIRDGYNLEVRKYNKNEIHDRYIITDKEMFLSGNSLNFLGKKDSFIVKLGSDMRQTVLEVFNRRWKIADKITKN